jgi:hypothetical protein
LKCRFRLNTTIENKTKTTKFGPKFGVLIGFSDIQDFMPQFESKIWQLWIFHCLISRKAISDRIEGHNTSIFGIFHFNYPKDYHNQRHRSSHIHQDKDFAKNHLRGMTFPTSPNMKRLAATYKGAYKK